MVPRASRASTGVCHLAAGKQQSKTAGFDVYNALTWISQAVVNEQKAPSA